MRVSVVLAVLGLFQLAPAQAVTLRAASTIEVGAAGMTSRVTNVIPNGSVMAPPAASVAANNQAGAVADAAFNLSVPLVVTAEFVASAANSYAMGAGAWGAGSVEWRLQGPARGWLVVEIDATAGSLASVVARARVTAPGIDVGLTATQGAAHTEHREYLDVSSSFAAVIDSSVSASPAAPFRTVRASVRTTLRFEPALPPVRQAAYGQACGAELRVVDATTAGAHDVTIETVGAFALAPVVLVFGDQRASDPIPTLPCLLLVRPIVVVPLVAGVLGTAAWQARFPGPRRGPSLYCQALAVDAAWQVRASTGVELGFVD